MSAADLRKMIDSASDVCQEMFAQNGEIGPMWHAVTRTGENFVTPHPRSVDKDTAAAMMRALFELRDVVRCLFISEAWIGESHDEAGIKKLNAWVDEYGTIPTGSRSWRSWPRTSRPANSRCTAGLNARAASSSSARSKSTI